MRRTLPLALALLLAGSAAAVAELPGAALGGAGEVYQVRSGAYGELFAGGQELDALTPVLALEVQRPGMAAVRLLVPGTRDAAVERSPYLFLEKETNGVYLVWESRPNLIHSQLMLQAYVDESWSDPIVVSGSDMTTRGAPRLVLTRDSYQQKVGSVLVTHRRTVIHLAWWEETPAGFAVLYSPLALIDGTFLGWNETFDLSQLTHEDGGTPLDVTDVTQLVPPTIQQGRDTGTMVLGFTNLQSGRLVSLEVRSLSAALGYLAEDLRSYLLANAPNYLPDRIEALGDAVRAHVLEVGTQFDPEVLAVIADKARGHIIETGHTMPTRPRLLAEKARGHIIETGAKLIGNGLRDEKGAANGQLVEVAANDRSDASDRPVAENIHWLELRPASSWPLPATNGDASTILLSEDGAEAIVAWQVADHVRYSETSASGIWKPQTQIQLGGDLTRERVFTILERRLRAH